MEWEEKWNRMNGELEVDEKIPKLWRMSAMLELVPNKLKDAILLHLGDIGDSYDKMKERILTYVANAVEQGRKQGGAVPMDVDQVEDWRWDGGADECGVCGDEDYFHQTWKKPQFQNTTQIKGVNRKENYITSKKKPLTVVQ